MASRCSLLAAAGHRLCCLSSRTLYNLVPCTCAAAIAHTLRLDTSHTSTTDSSLLSTLWPYALLAVTHHSSLITVIRNKIRPSASAPPCVRSSSLSVQLSTFVLLSPHLDHEAGRPIREVE